MKKLTSILFPALLAVASAHASAQALITAATTPADAPKTVQAPASAPREQAVPKMPEIKDFKAARDLELERTKFQLAQIEKYRKCLNGTKTAESLTACQVTYREDLKTNLAKLTEQGKFAAAYDYGANPMVKQPAPPKK